jgi:predicted nuclease with TOPRIM domain
MTEMGQHWGQTEEYGQAAVEGEHSESEGAFLAFADALREENERLVGLAEACRDNAQKLVEREARLAERERRLAEAEEGLARRTAELDQRERHVNELAARGEEAGARLAEAAEREAALAALGAQLIERYPT